VEQQRKVIALPIIIGLVFILIGVFIRKEGALEFIGIVLFLFLFAVGFVLWVLIQFGEGWSGDSGGDADIQRYALTSIVWSLCNTSLRSLE
jgi:hypothetical membrane protein